MGIPPQDKYSEQLRLDLGGDCDLPASDKPLLVWHLTDRGFGSEINVMLLAILYCLENDYSIALCSKGGTLLTRTAGKITLRDSARNSNIQI